MDIDKIPLIELIGNLQTYELGLTRIEKSSKSKSMALKAKKSLDDEDSKMKSYITRQFKKFMKNANGKGFDKDHRQTSSSQFKSQDQGKRLLGMVVSALFSQDQSALGVKVSVI